jgi:hypothetical protein
MLPAYDLASQVANLDSNRHCLLIPTMLVAFDHLLAFLVDLLLDLMSHDQASFFTVVPGLPDR